MSSSSGKPMDGIVHLKQSIRDILTTPIGTRIMQRDYGSRLFQLIDRPSNADLMIELYTATAEALLKWEPRFKLERVQVEDISDGTVTLRLEGIYVPENRQIQLSGLML